MDLTRLDEIVDSYKDQIIADIQKWVAVPSVMGAPAGTKAPFGAQVRKMLDVALETARGYGFEARDVDGYCGDVTLCEGKQTLGMLCHLDVVPAGDGWTKDPWGGEVSGGRIYGRGTMDDKGPALAALHAMRAVRAAGIPMSDGVRLILGCDEETGMTDMAYYKSKLPAPDYGFSPDAEFPVINIEKGGLSLTLSQYTGDEEGAEIPVYEMYAGERCNVVPGIATAKVGYARIGIDDLQRRIEKIASIRDFDLDVRDLGDETARITAQGLSAHASTPELGVNAAGMLLIALKDIGAGGGVKGAIAALAEKIGLEYDGASLGISTRDEESGALTCNLGLLRFDGRNISAQLDIRYPLCADEEKMCGQAAMAISGTGLSVRRNGGHTPHHVPKDHKVVKGLVKVYSEVTGKPGYAFAIGGGTYSRCMPNTVAFGFNFPGDTDTCHMPDEYVEIDKFMLSVKIFAHAIAELAGAPADGTLNAIAIDGPAGAGKSSVAQEVAARLNMGYLDTGAMYRAMGYYMLKNGIDPADAAAVTASCEDVQIDVKYEDGKQRTLLMGEDVSGEIRLEKCSAAAAAVSAVARVRERMVDLQKKIAAERRLVMDGRDIGTKVLPGARLKIYLTASEEERADRRVKQLREKGIEADYEKVLSDIKERDYSDMHRAVSPLTRASDAIEIDCTHMSMPEVVERIVELAGEAGI